MFIVAAVGRHRKFLVGTNENQGLFHYLGG